MRLLTGKEEDKARSINPQHLIHGPCFRRRRLAHTLTWSLRGNREQRFLRDQRVSMATPRFASSWASARHALKGSAAAYAQSTHYREGRIREQSQQPSIGEKQKKASVTSKGAFKVGLMEFAHACNKASIAYLHPWRLSRYLLIATRCRRRIPHQLSMSTSMGHAIISSRADTTSRSTRLHKPQRLM